MGGTYSGIIYNKSSYELVYVVSFDEKVYTDGTQKFEISNKVVGKGGLDGASLQASAKISYKDCKNYKFEKAYAIVTVQNEMAINQGIVNLKKNQKAHFSLFVGKQGSDGVKGYPLFLNVPIQSNANILWKVTFDSNSKKVVCKSISQNKGLQLVQKYSGDQTTAPTYQ